MENRNRRAGTATKRRVRREEKPAKKQAVDVVYTQPKPFSRAKLMLRLGTIVAVVLALVLGMSIFFKVAHVEVAGVSNYTEWDILQAAGIQEGENLLTLSKAAVSGRILQHLPYVDSVRIGIRLPDTVQIEIVEEDVAYAIQASDNTWWLMDDSGKILEQTNNADAADHTLVTGVLLDAPVVGQMAVAFEPQLQQTPEDSTDETDMTEATTPITVYASERLDAAKEVLRHLESNGILGTITSLDVSDPAWITMEYGQVYHIQLGDTSQLARKASFLADTLAQYGTSFQKGTLDISFTVKTDNIVFTPEDAEE